MLIYKLIQIVSSIFWLVYPINCRLFSKQVWGILCYVLTDSFVYIMTSKGCVRILISVPDLSEEYFSWRTWAPAFLKDFLLPISWGLPHIKTSLLPIRWIFSSQEKQHDLQSWRKLNLTENWRKKNLLSDKWRMLFSKFNQVWSWSRF